MVKNYKVAFEFVIEGVEEVPRNILEEYVHTGLETGLSKAGFNVTIFSTKVVDA